MFDDFVNAAYEACAPVMQSWTAMAAPCSTPCHSPNTKLVLGKYVMDMTADGIVGEGTFSICRKGTIMETGEPVAIKVYKTDGGKRVATMNLKKAVAVLQELQKPICRPSDPTLWSSHLETAKPSKIFMRILDYSKNAKGLPGADYRDGELYLVTELGSYGLKEYLKHHREQGTLPSKESVRTLAKAILMVTAGLHAKGYAHMDLKPENFMIFDGVLKLIDVDACMQIDSTVTSGTASFSPCYIAPEFASFVLRAAIDSPHNEAMIPVLPSLDAWSVGCTILELVTLEPITRPKLTECIHKDKKQARRTFMKWLQALQEAPVPDLAFQRNPELVQFATSHFLVCGSACRTTCAEAMNDPYLSDDKLHRNCSCPITASYEEDEWPMEVF